MSILQEAPVATDAAIEVSRETLANPALWLLKIEYIEPNPFQPRQTFSEEELENLANSIREHGVLQPVLVRPHPEKQGWVQLIAGERRWRAATRAGLKEIPATVRDIGDKEALELAIIENVQRVDVSPIESAKSYRRLAKEFDLSQNEIAQRVGKTRPVIANAMRLLDLPESVQQLIEEGRLSEAHGRALAGYSEYKRFLEVYVPLILPFNYNSKDFEKELPIPWQLKSELIKAKVVVRTSEHYNVREAAKAYPKAFHLQNDYICIDPELDKRLSKEGKEKIDAEAKALLEKIAGPGANLVNLDTLKWEQYERIWPHDKALEGCTRECPCRAMGTSKSYPQPCDVCLDPKRRKGLKSAETRKANAAKKEAAKKDFEAISKTSDTVKHFVYTSRPEAEKEVRRALAILIRPALKGAKVDVLRAAMARRGWTKEQFDITKLKEYEAGKTLDELMKLSAEDMISFTLEVDLHQEIQECLDTGYRGRHNADWFLQIKKKQKPSPEAKAETSAEAPPEPVTE